MGEIVLIFTRILETSTMRNVSRPERRIYMTAGRFKVGLIKKKVYLNVGVVAIIVLRRDPFHKL